MENIDDEWILDNNRKKKHSKTTAYSSAQRITACIKEDDFIDNDEQF